MFLKLKKILDLFVSGAQPVLLGTTSRNFLLDSG